MDDPAAMMAIRQQKCPLLLPEARLSVSKDSCVITKPTTTKARPKIRIVHIFAPEIIETDAANFRELVQRLTGKSATGERTGGRRKKRTGRGVEPVTLMIPKEEMSPPPPAPEVETSDSQHGSEEIGFVGEGRVTGEEHEEESWIGESSSDDLFGVGGLGDLDGFIQGFFAPQEAPMGSSLYAHLFGSESPGSSQLQVGFQH